MSNRNIKEFNQFLFDKALMEEVAMLDDVQTDTVVSKKYNELYFNQLLMMDIVSDSVSESLEDVVLKILAGEWDKNAQNFYDSMMSSKRISFLTPYTVEELKSFDLYKVKGYKIGFAIKNNEIILVHNNEGIKGIGKHLMKKAIQYGGRKLDHFDGFLTGFYKRLKFNVKSNDYFDLEFAPEEWKYISVNIADPENSIYVNEIKVSEPAYDDAKTRYEKGMPDIVYRTLENISKIEKL